MESPLVSVICLCHNQADFIAESIDSVLNQTYEHVELIIVDDGSTDGSKSVILNFLKNHDIPYVDIPDPIGNCKAFNEGWRKTKGEYVIDLAGDDVLMPNRIAVGVQRLIKSNSHINYSNAYLINERGDLLCKHNDRFDFEMPEGDLYEHLVREYLICPPTMLIKQDVLQVLNGYDETLAYEDFDFWVRSAREFSYCYSDEPLVKKRILKNSHSKTQMKFRNSHQRSTLDVCRKILRMNKTKEEGKALRTRCWYEIRQCIKKGNLELIPSYLSILKQC